MKIKKLPPVEVLREYLDYNPGTGELRWRKKTHARHSIRVGDIAGSRKNTGYGKIQFNGLIYLAHRIAWALHYGEDPYPHIVDHKEGVERGDAISNLRLVDISGNGLNRKLQGNNKSGHRGVCWCERCKRWRAQITLKGKKIQIGTYTEIKDAINARLKAEEEYNIFVRD